MSGKFKYSLPRYEDTLQRLLSETESLSKKLKDSSDTNEKEAIEFFVFNLESLINQLLMQLKYHLTQNHTDNNFTDILFRISEAEYFSKSIVELYSKLFTILNEYIPVRNFYISTSINENLEFPFEYSHPENDLKDNFNNIKFGKTLAENFNKGTKAVSVNVNINDSDLSSAENAAEWLGVPLLKPDKTSLGSLVIQKLDNNKFTEDEKKIISFAARQLVLSIERKNSDIILQRNEKQLRNLFDKNPLMIFSVDSDYIIHNANNQVYDELGYSKDELIKYSFLDISSYKDHSVIKENISKCINNKEDKLTWNSRKIAKNGEVIWTKEIASATEDYSGNLKVLIVCENINEHVDTDRRLSDLSHFNELLLNSAAEGILGLDIKGKIIFANPSASEMVDWETEELIGKSIHEIIHNLNPEGKPYKENKNAFLDTIKNKSTHYRNDEYFWKRTGRFFPTAYKCNPVIENDVVVGAVITFQDISEQKKAEEEIKKYIKEIEHNKNLIQSNADELTELNKKLILSEEKLKDLNQNKDRFFSIISHDLRSPFTSLLGFSEYMAKYSDDFSGEELKEYATHMYQATKNILNLLENLLQWSRVQTGRIEFIPENIDMKEMIQKAVELYSGNAITKQIELVPEVDGYTVAFADKNMIDTVLRNLISNAIKFSNPNDKIYIRASLKDDKVYVEIEDTGIGMSQSKLNKLFRIDSSFTTDGTSKERGSGLGLILCKEFVEKNNGEISVESSISKGSKFKFYIPAAKHSKKYHQFNSLTNSDN
ncbi:MAG: PAS domain S-box protein [Bacteroidetes bacterium]|nr:PAS domain S-box protein [Bacteroidota bacterium]